VLTSFQTRAAPPAKPENKLHIQILIRKRSGINSLPAVIPPSGLD